MQSEETMNEKSPARALLSEEELSSLMEMKSKEGGSQSGSEKRSRITTYDFRRPDRVSKEQVRSIYLLHDAFARNLSSSLSNFLRAVSEVTLMSVEQRPYVDYLARLPDPAAMFKISVNPLEGMAILEVSPSVAFPLIDRQLGGPGVPFNDARPLTEIEQNILEGFLTIVNESLRAAWKPIIEIDFQSVGCETCPKLVQIVAPNEVVLCIVFDIQIADARGTLSLCIPAVNLEPILQKLNESSYSRMHSCAPPAQTRSILDKLSAVHFPVAAELRGTPATINDLMRLSPGDVLRLDHRVDEPVEVSVAGIVKFHGELAVSDNRTAVYIKPLDPQGQCKLEANGK
jgi:flagellar motor switch protein FliM